MHYFHQLCIGFIANIYFPKLYLLVWDLALTGIYFLIHLFFTTSSIELSNGLMPTFPHLLFWDRSNPGPSSDHLPPASSRLTVVLDRPASTELPRSPLHPASPKILEVCLSVSSCKIFCLSYTSFFFCLSFFVNLSTCQAVSLFHAV